MALFGLFNKKKKESLDKGLEKTKESVFKKLSRAIVGKSKANQLLAGLAVACRYGFEIPDALDIAEKTYVNVNIHQEENKARLETLDQLPDSCAASAKRLQQQRGIFEQHNVFSPSMIDGIIKKLLSYNDTTLREDLKNDPEGMLELVNRYFHCG